MSAFDFLPESLRSNFSSVEPVQSGSSGALVYRVRGGSGPVRYLKMSEGKYIRNLIQEIERTKWLSKQRINVPKILQVVIQTDFVAILMSCIDGQPVEDWRGLPEDAIKALAKGFADLHAMPINSCPFSEDIEVRLTRACTDISHGCVDLNHFNERNLGLTPQELLDRLLRVKSSVTEDVVVVHGDATFENILVDSTGRIGFVDCGHCGRADRYVDLALLSEQIADRFGPQWVGAFLKMYAGSTSSDPLKMRFFLDLYDLF
jgi:aminoglycoside 3'-phosphotransferase II